MVLRMGQRCEQLEDSELMACGIATVEVERYVAVRTARPRATLPRLAARWIAWIAAAPAESEGTLIPIRRTDVLYRGMARERWAGNRKANPCASSTISADHPSTVTLRPSSHA